MPNHNAARAAAQERVIPLADNWGQEWTQAELEYFEVFQSEPAEQLALALGRTVYAVNTVRDRLREGQPVGQGARTRGRHMRALAAAPWPASDPRWLA